MKAQHLQLWVATYAVSCLFQASASTASAAVASVRRLQTTVQLCRCQATFERLYNNRDLQTSLERELKGPYDYSQSSIDSDGYYIIDGVRVLPDNDEQCYKTRRGRLSPGKGGTTKAKDDSNKRHLTNDLAYTDESVNDTYDSTESDAAYERDNLSRRLRSKGKGKGKGNGERRGKGIAKKVSGKASGNSDYGKSGKASGKWDVSGKSGESGMTSGKGGKGKASMSRGKGNGKGKGKKTCRARPFDADCLPPIRPCSNKVGDTTDVPTSAPQDQIVVTPTVLETVAPTVAPTLSETSGVETLTPTAVATQTPTRTNLETVIPTSVPQALIIGTPTSVPVAFLEPTVPTSEPTTFLTSVVPTAGIVSSSPAPSTAPSTQPSTGPSLAVCLECTASNACFQTSCLDDGSCVYTPVLSCPVGESCDPSTGSCRSQNDLRPCVAVIDESSQSSFYLDSKWNEFRTTYPQRPFCLLQPVNDGFIDPANRNGLYLPPAFLNDTRATQFNITREDGKEVIPNPPLADWFDLCDIAVYAATGVEFVGFYVDISGSMDESTVRSMLTNFTTALNRTGLAFKQLYDGNEDWILPFVRELATL